MILLEQLTAEALGVPNHLIETATDVYNKLVDELENLSSSTPVDLASTPKSFTFNGDFPIGDTVFKKIKIDLNVVIDFFGDGEIRSQGAAFALKVKLDDTYKKLVKIDNPNKEIDLEIRISAPLTLEDDPNTAIVNYFKGKGKKDTIIQLSHELKHAYDYEKESKTTDVSKNLHYAAKSQLRGGIRALDDMSFLSYYTDAIENLVRPSEMAAELKVNGVTKKEFKSALLLSPVYDLLKKAREFSYDTLKQNLINNSDFVDEARYHLENDGIRTGMLSDEEVINEILKIHFEEYKNSLKDSYNYLLSGKAQEKFKILGEPTSEDKENIRKELDNAYGDLSNKLDKYDNYEKFFRSVEKEMHINAEKALRRLAKLYAYID